MTQPDSIRPPVDWRLVRETLRRVLSGRLDASDRDELDDLVQEGCIRMMRSLRRETVDDSEALSVVIADRTFKDFLRRRYRSRRVLSRMDDSVHEMADSKGVHEHLRVDLLERLEFVIVAMFSKGGKAECAELARQWFASKDWRQVAENVGKSHVAIRKQWSRCLDLPKERLASDPDYRHLFRWG